MTRRELREQIFKLLFRVEFNNREEMPEQTEFFFEEEENQADVADTAYITDKLNRILHLHLSMVFWQNLFRKINNAECLHCWTGKFIY